MERIPQSDIDDRWSIGRKTPLFKTVNYGMSVCLSSLAAGIDPVLDVTVFTRLLAWDEKHVLFAGGEAVCFERRLFRHAKAATTGAV